MDAYKEFNGDIQAIIDNVLCATIEDEDRFIGLIQEEIKAGRLSRLRKFTSDCAPAAKKKRKRAADAEAKEAEAMAKEMGLKKGEENDLQALQVVIRERAQNRFDSMIANIENKYAKTATKKQSKGDVTSSDKKKRKKATVWQL